MAQQLCAAQLHQFQIGGERLPFVRRQRSQQMVSVQIGL
jgi:hypothetical protein